MSNQKDKQYCIEIINEFLELENQKGNYNYLENFNFGRLGQYNHKIYGKFRASSDEDSFHIVKCIYYILWYKHLPFISNFAEMEDYYGGDTISPIRNSNYYLTLGNFMLLPKKSSGNTTLNRYKYCCFRDDMFEMCKKFKEMFNFYNNKTWINENIYNATWEKIIEANKFYFENIKTYNKFLEINYLKDYTDSTNNIEEIIKNRSKKMVKTLKEIISE